MSEGNHSAVETSTKSRRSKLPLIIGGIAVSALIGGVLFQFMKSEPTAAQVESETSAEGAGSVHIQKRPGELKTLANVNGQLVTRDMVALECLNRYGADVLESIIDRLIVQQACEAQGIQITTAEIDAEVIKIAKNFNLTPDNWYQMLQAERKITPDQYRRNIIWPMLALRRLAGENVEITDEDLRRAYIRDYGEKVQARMIMLDNKRRADEVWEKANANPESFGELARKFSIEANSRSLDGAIPPIKRYGSNEESALEEAAFKLKEKGEISGIIQIGVGQQYVILQYEGRTKCMVQFEEVKESLIAQIKEEKTQLQVANIFSKLKESAKIQNFVTNEVSGGVKKASATAGGPERVTPAAATRTRQAGSQQPQQRPRQAQRPTQGEN
jgi:foldase protein PrsA